MQQQQQADYDLLAVFTDESKANAAVAKLHKEGFTEEEIYQLEATGKGQFREHGPNSERRDFFLETKRSGPNPLLVVILAVVFGLVVGGLSYVAGMILPNLAGPVTWIIGAIIGLIAGAVIAIVPMSRVRGNIGQDLSKRRPEPKEQASGARTVVALRFPDTDNPARRSRARAILLNNGGKIDRSVGRRE